MRGEVGMAAAVALYKKCKRTIKSGLFEGPAPSIFTGGNCQLTVQLNDQN